MIGFNWDDDFEKLTIPSLNGKIFEEKMMEYEFFDEDTDERSMLQGKNINIKKNI